MKRAYTEDMDEISGFGGGYEACCRAMVLAGLDWLDAHPEAKPEFHGLKGVYGICIEDNDDAKALSTAMVTAAEPLGGATGAMHQACVGHVLAARRLGWDGYCAELRKREVAS